MMIEKDVLKFIDDSLFWAILWHIELKWSWNSSSYRPNWSESSSVLSYGDRSQCTPQPTHPFQGIRSLKHWGRDFEVAFFRTISWFNLLFISAVCPCKKNRKSPTPIFLSFLFSLKVTYYSWKRPHQGNQNINQLLHIWDSAKKTQKMRDGTFDVDANESHGVGAWLSIYVKPI